MSFFRKLFFKKVAGIRDTYVLEEGDIALDEDDGKLYRGDGSTVGGILIQSTAGISLTDISSATTAPSGGGALVYNNSNGQITYTPPDLSGLGSQNLFSTIASAGQNNIVADGPTDILYIEAGSGISIATDENTDTLTITATGGGGGLSNIVEDTTPQLGGDLDLNSNNITGTGNIPAANLTGVLPALDGSNLTSVQASSVQVTESIDDNVTYNVLFSDTAGSGSVQMTPIQDDGGITFNPSNNTL